MTTKIIKKGVLMKRDLKNQLAKYSNAELVEILYEVFLRKTTYGIENGFERWLLINNNDIFDIQTNGFIPRSDLYDDPFFLYIGVSENKNIGEDFLQSGGCDCSLNVICVEKIAKCPHCFDTVYCT